MLDFEKVRGKEKTLLQKLEKAKSDYARHKMKEREAARRDDTRRKIVLGGMVLAGIEAGDVTADFVAGLVRAHVAERDKRLFVGTPFAVSEMTDSGVAESGSRE
jgi:hypothetical protein